MILVVFVSTLMTLKRFLQRTINENIVKPLKRKDKHREEKTKNIHGNTLVVPREMVRGMIDSIGGTTFV